MAIFALGEHFIHPGDCPADLGNYLCRRGSFRSDAFRRLPPIGHMPQFHHQNERQQLPRLASADLRRGCLQATVAPSDRLGISEVEMLQNFRGAPLPFQVPDQVLAAANTDP